MRRIWNIPLKVAVGYAFFVIVLAVAVLLLCRYTRSAIQLSYVEQEVSARWNASNSLVYCLFEVENIERAVSMGQTDRMEAYERAVGRAMASADSLVAVLSDTVQRTRVDTLRLLLADRLDNTRQLARLLGKAPGKRLYEQKAEQLRSGRDSLMLRHDVGKSVKETRVTYVVEKTRPTFFGRLADVFRRSKSDTTAMKVDSTVSSAGTDVRSIDVSDTVASVLTDIGRREERLSRSRRDRIVRSGNALQAAGMELSLRMEQIMQSISSAETQWMQQAVADDAARRFSIVIRMALLAAFSVILAVVLSCLVWRDNRRAERYRRSLEEARSRAENLLEQRERLLLTITHDIKSPVSAISGFTELLRPHVAGAQPRAFLDNIRSSAIHLLRLVGALLDYHQLEQGRLTVSEVSFSPSRLVTDCVESFRPRADAKGLSLRCCCGGGADAVCRGDAFRMRQIAENLIGNALKYTAEGSVTVTADVSDGRLCLSVADTGQGMTADESRRIFQAFTRLPGAQGIEGVGLGLSITRELVSLLGGTISLDTAPGRGSTFTVELPVAEEPSVASLPQPSGASAAQLPPSSAALPATLRVLIIDDDALQLRLVSEMLRRLSSGRWTIVACSDIDDMFACLDSEPFDLLLTDIEMPAMNGFEIASRLRDRNLPVVAMTAHDTLAADDFSRAGFAASLGKPVTMTALAEVISRVAHCEDVSAPPSPPASSSSAPAPLRLSALTAFAEGDEAAAHEILRSFREQTSKDIETLRRAAESNDVKAAGELAHRLIPVFTMIESPVVPVLRKMADARNRESVKELGLWCGKVIEEMERGVLGELGEL